MASSIVRRSVITGVGATLAAPAVLRWPAHAAQFEFKVADNLPVSHPMNVRLTEAVARIQEQTSGKVSIKTFPNNVLGGDTEMLSQLRSGALEFFLLSGGILSSLSPVTAIYNTAFIFKDMDAVWSAMDGPLGAFLRTAIEKVNLHAMPKLWNNGFRQMTSSAKPIRTPADLDGFKMRVPPSRIYVSAFKGLGASPTTLNFSELYSALQTGVVDGQENALALIETAKLFEVQKYVAMTNHAWDGFFMLSNGRVWKQLDARSQEIISDSFDDAALKMRADTMKLDGTAAETLKTRGMTFTKPDGAGFRQKLEAAGYYTDWRTTFGEDAWSVLESQVGKLT